MTPINAVIWFSDEANYLRFKEMCADGKEMPKSYSEWLSMAEKKLNFFQGKGLIFRKVKADPDSFFLWCKINSVAADEKARARYAGVLAMKADHTVN